MPAIASTPVALMSGTYTKDDISKAQSFGNLKFLVKPFAEEVFFALFDYKVEKKKEKRTFQPPSNSNAKESLDLQIVKGQVGKVELHHDKNKVTKGGGNITDHGTSSQGFTGHAEVEKSLAGHMKMSVDQASGGEFDFTQERQNSRQPGGDLKVKRPGEKGWDLKQSKSQASGTAFDLSVSKLESSASDMHDHRKRGSFSGDLREKKLGESDDEEDLIAVEDPLFGNDIDEDGSNPGMQSPSLAAALASTDLGSLEESLGDNQFNVDSLDLDEKRPNTEEASNSRAAIIDINTLQPRRSKAQVDAMPRKIAMTQHILGENHEIPVPKSALIVASDASWGEIVSQYLEQLGTPIRDVIEDCDRAWTLSQTDYYDLIMLDWDTKGLSALCFYNRVRSRSESADVPIIVMSGQVNRQEFRLLGESSFTRILEKPVQYVEFERVLHKSLVTSFSHRLVAEQVTKVLGEPGGEQQAVKLLRRASKEVPDAFSFLVVAGKFFNAAKRTEMAETFFKMALERDPHSLSALVELSRIYHTTKRSDQAIELLGRAYELSPDSVERLCMMGEIGLTLKQTEDAKKYFEKALNIDAESKKAKAGLGLTEHLGEYLRDHGTETASWQSLASMLNTIGVSMVRGANYSKGFEHYEAASVFINEPDVLAKLHFNLGIGFLRYGDIEKGVTWLRSACERMPSGYPKAQMFLKAAEKELQKKVKKEGA